MSDYLKLGNFNFPIECQTITEFTGEGGSGKSNFALWLAFLFMKKFYDDFYNNTNSGERHRTVVYLHTKDFPSSRLKNFIENNLNENYDIVKFMAFLIPERITSIESYQYFMNSFKDKQKIINAKVVFIDDLTFIADSFNDLNNNILEFNENEINNNIENIENKQDLNQSFISNIGNVNVNVNLNVNLNNISTTTNHEALNNENQSLRLKFLYDQIEILNYICRNMNCYVYVLNSVSSLFINDFNLSGEGVYDKYMFKPKLGEIWSSKMDARFLFSQLKTNDNFNNSGVSYKFIETIYCNYSVNTVNILSICESNLELILM